MHRFIYFLIGLAIACSIAQTANAQIAYPNRGGTGTGVIPTSGQILIGQPNGTYLPVATSTLGISAGSSGIGTTSPWTIGNLVQVVSNSIVKSIATSTFNIALTDTTGTLSVSRGGTGSTTLGGILKGAGSAAIQTAIAGTDYLANNLGDWLGTFQGQNAAYYLSRANHTGTQLAATISDFSTAARALFSSTANGLTYTSGTGVFSLTSGYVIPLIASTTEWFNFYTTPSTRITAGNNVTWSGNILNDVGLATTSINSSAKLAAIVADAVGTGNFVLNSSPVFTGVASFAALSSASSTLATFIASTSVTANATTTNAFSTRLILSGLSTCSSSTQKPIVDASGNWTCGVDAAGSGGTSNWSNFPGFITPSTTVGITVNASSSILSLTAGNATETNSTTTNEFVTNSSSTNSTSTLSTIRKLFDNTGSAGTNGQFLTSNGSTTLWQSTSTLSYLMGLNGLTGSFQALATGTPASGGWGFTSSGFTHTLNIPQAGVGSPFGLLSSADWTTFNNKQPTVTAGSYLSFAGSILNALGLATTSIDNSSKLSGILTDETGTGNAVFSASPIFSGTPTFTNLFSASSTLQSFIATTSTTTSATTTNTFNTRLILSGLGACNTSTQKPVVDASGNWTCGTDTSGSGGSGSNWTNFAGFITPSTTVGITVNASSSILALSVGNATTTNLSSGILAVGQTGTTSVTASGFLGVGTTSPISRLSVAGTNLISGTAAVVGSVNTLANAFIYTTDPQGVDVGGMLALGGSNDAASAVLRTFGGIRGAKESSSAGVANGYLGFYTSQSGANFGERARISSTGLFGIGTTSPLAKLDVLQTTGGSNALFSVASSTNGIGTTTLFSINSAGTTTIANGVNITAGCFAVNGTCLSSGGGAGTVNSGGTGQFAYYSATGTAVSGTSSITASNITATGTVTVGVLSGIIKAVSGVLQVATAGTDYIVNNLGDWAGTFAGNNSAFYLNRTNHTGSQLSSTISDFLTAVQNIAVGTTTNGVAGNLAMWTGTRTLGTVATTSLTASGALALSNPISVIGSIASAISCATASGSLTGCLSSTDWTTFNSKLATTSIDTSAKLSGILTDETGTGAAVFAGSPTFTGTAGFASLFGASSTLAQLYATNTTITNSSTTNATTTNLFATRFIPSGLGICNSSTQKPITDGAGNWTCGTDTAGGGGGGSFPFAADTNYGQVVYSTSTPTLWFKSGFFASSTSFLDSLTVTNNATFTNATTTNEFVTNASTTNATISLATIRKLFDFTGSAGTNGQFLTSSGSTTAWASTSTLGYIMSLNGQAQPLQSFATTSNAGGFGFSSASGVHTFNIPVASASTDRGLLTATDWTTFNNKQSAITAGNNLAFTGTTLNDLALATSSISTSALLAGILTDETGTGFSVFNSSPTFAGNALFNQSSTTFASTTMLSTQKLFDFTGNPGTNGQILTSNGSTTLWTTSVSGASSTLLADSNTFTGGYNWFTNKMVVGTSSFSPATSKLTLYATTTASAIGASSTPLFSLQDGNPTSVGVFYVNGSEKMGRTLAFADSSTTAQMFLSDYPQSAVTDGWPAYLGNWNATGLWGFGADNGSNQTVRMGAVTSQNKPWSSTSQANMILAIASSTFGQKVSIGTTSSFAALTAHSIAGPQLFLSNSTNGSGAKNFYGSTTLSGLDFGFANNIGTVFTPSLSFLTDGRIGVGSTTPWAQFSIASSTYGYLAPLFAVSTSSGPAGIGFIVSATTTVQLANAFTNSVPWNGIKAAIGIFSEYGFGGLLDTFSVNGTFRQPDVARYYCPGGLGMAFISSATSNVCGVFRFLIDGAGSLASGNASGDYFTLQTAGVANAGVGIFAAGSGSNPWMIMATSTPSFETSISLDAGGVAVGTTTRYAGFANLNTGGSAYEVEPTAGCYFTASSTQNNWIALCRTSATAVTLIDTGLSTSTAGSGRTEFYRFRIDADVNGATFYTQTASTTMKKVGTITTNYPATTKMMVGIYDANTLVPSATNETNIQYIDFQFRKTLWRDE